MSCGTWVPIDTCNKASAIPSTCVHYNVPFPRYVAISKNCHICTRSLAHDKSLKNCTCALFLPRGAAINFIFCLRAAISKETGKLHISIYVHMQSDHFETFQKFHIHSVSMKFSLLFVPRATVIKIWCFTINPEN